MQTNYLGDNNPPVPLATICHCPHACGTKL